ncbi:MAG: SDR family oxidoreductase [Erysipelotrichaceae bacterium]|jgi:short-subunit dehydrogenase|nr:SDR family oxidoreductase [Erysipelotrichaceae bacterium]
MLKPGQSVVITGASDGLGKAIALELASREELNFILCGRDRRKLETVVIAVKEINPGARIAADAFDLIESEAAERFFNEAIARFDSIDYLINNAGANSKKDKVTELDIQDLRYMMELNCLSGVEMIQRVYPAMKEQGSGQIINILSSCCLFPNPTMGAYTASKAAMEAITKILAKEAKEDHIKVTAVYPGGINTNFRQLDRPDYLSPEAVAQAICNLMDLPDEALPQELVLRPWVENNY